SPSRSATTSTLRTETPSVSPGGRFTPSDAVYSKVVAWVVIMLQRVADASTKPTAARDAMKRDFTDPTGRASATHDAGAACILDALIARDDVAAWCAMAPRCRAR